MGRTSLCNELTDAPFLMADDAQPVGRTPAARVTYPSATLIAYNTILIYQDEVPLTRTEILRKVEYQRELIHLPTKRIYFETYRHYWGRDEYSLDKIDQKEHNISLRSSLVRAECPYAACNVHYSIFKLAYSGTKPEFVLGNIAQPWKRAAPDKEYVTSERGLEERIEALPYDYWAHGSQLVAGSFVSTLSVGAAGKIIYRSDAEWSLGICADFEKYHQELKASAAAKKLLHDTQTGHISFVNPKAGFRHRPWPETILQCERIIDIAIAQALAGIDPRNKEEEKFRGRPVMERIVYLYEDGLDRYNKRISDKKSGEKRAAEEEKHFLKDSRRNVPFRH